MSDRFEPTPVPLGDGRHDIGDETRAAIFRRLHDDFTLAAPWMTAEQRRQLAMFAAASVRALLHELGTLRDLVSPASSGSAVSPESAEAPSVPPEKEIDGDEIVGHKTFATGRMGACGLPELRHEPLTRAEAESVLAESKRQEQQRAADMPDERSAVNAMWRAYQRLRELGWRDVSHCPKDGSIFPAIEAGSAGIHECSYQGTWPDGHWFIHADGDLWPSRPVLFKPEPSSPSYLASPDVEKEEGDANV